MKTEKIRLKQEYNSTWTTTSSGGSIIVSYEEDLVPALKQTKVLWEKAKEHSRKLKERNKDVS